MELFTFSVISIFSEVSTQFISFIISCFLSGDTLNVVALVLIVFISFSGSVVQRRKSTDLGGSSRISNMAF